MEFIKKIIGYGERIFLTIGVLCLATIVVIITGGIITRYVFGSPFSWTEELATFLFIWLCFSGASVAANRKKHVVADYMINRTGGKFRYLIQSLTYILIIAFLVAVFYASVLLQPNLLMHTSINLGIPRNYYYLPLLVSSFYMTIVYLFEFIETLKEGKKILFGSKESFASNPGTGENL